MGQNDIPYERYVNSQGDHLIQVIFLKDSESVCFHIGPRHKGDKILWIQVFIGFKLERDQC